MGHFYQQHIPQSEYRKNREEGAAQGGHSINLTLAELGLQEDGQQIKDELINKIQTESKKIVRALLLEPKWPEILESSCFKDIHQKLGLL